MMIISGWKRLSAGNEVPKRGQFRFLTKSIEAVNFSLRAPHYDQHASHSI